MTLKGSDDVIRETFIVLYHKPKLIIFETWGRKLSNLKNNTFFCKEVNPLSMCVPISWSFLDKKVLVRVTRGVRNL
jgi:hypothetical protein